MAWTEEFVTRPRTAPPCARSPTPRALARCRRPASGTWLSLLLDGPARADLELDAGHLAGLRRTQAGARDVRSTTSPTDEVKADQKEFFRLLYHLLVDADRGPRLPTLIVALRRRTGRGALLGGLSLAAAASAAAGLESRRNVRAALPLVVLADRPRRQGEHRQAAQEAAVGLVLPRHRAVTLPTVAAQHGRGCGGSPTRA